VIDALDPAEVPRPLLLICDGEVVRRGDPRKRVIGYACDRCAPSVVDERPHSYSVAVTWATPERCGWCGVGQRPPAEAS